MVSAYLLEYSVGILGRRRGGIDLSRNIRAMTYLHGEVGVK